MCRTGVNPGPGLGFGNVCSYNFPSTYLNGGKSCTFSVNLFITAKMALKAKPAPNVPSQDGDAEAKRQGKPCCV